MKLKTTILLLLLAIFTAVPIYGSDLELDQRLMALSQQPQSITNGQVLFQQICASCHGKDLSGGSGFNLKDAEWVHGGQPSQILHSVKTGFLSSGMPGFGMMFNEQQLQDIVAYVLSKKQGWDTLSYRLYQLESDSDVEITEAKLIKVGSLPKGLADFSIPEITHYYIEFEGDFYAPTDQDTQVWLEWGFPHEVFMYVDGQLVERGGKPWYPTWRLKRGKQKLKITYRSGTSKLQQRNLVLLGTNLDLTVKLFAVSTKAQAVLDSKSFEIKASNKPVIQRKRIHQLPPSTISVGLPQKLNYAFNTKSCSVVGIWQGEMLNIGPNIAGRGEDPSLPLGSWVLKHPEQISHFDGNNGCRYLGYKIEAGYPVFKYQINKTSYWLRVEAQSANALSFSYETKSSKVPLLLPETSNIQWSRQQIIEANSDDALRKITLTATLVGQ